MATFTEITGEQYTGPSCYNAEEGWSGNWFIASYHGKELWQEGQGAWELGRPRRKLSEYEEALADYDARYIH